MDDKPNLHELAKERARRFAQEPKYEPISVAAVAAGAVIVSNSFFIALARLPEGFHWGASLALAGAVGGVAFLWEWSKQKAWDKEYNQAFNDLKRQRAADPDD